MSKTDSLIRRYEDSDGRCCASVAGDTGCLILSGGHKDCGTYACPFYKPEGCRDWIRLDLECGVRLIPPDDYY